MFIVTAVGRDGERAGCLVGFATQCSIQPPRFLACISRENRTFDVVTEAESSSCASGCRARAGCPS
jgi:flavin reductase (DIM6/NTAB) family NADH-FMN oxidoreductase RutF